jgi:predicted RNase H-related nuclease YkuK (DUF458 family)
MNPLLSVKEGNEITIEVRHKIKYGGVAFYQTWSYNRPTRISRKIISRAARAISTMVFRLTLTECKAFKFEIFLRPGFLP